MARSYGRAVVQVLPAWVAARVLVAVSLVLAHLVVNVARPDNVGAHLRVHEGLLGWDAGWYEAIAGHGYVAAGAQSVRFYPAYPMAARALAWIPGISVGTALLVISNLCALAALAALLVLVRNDLADGELARRSVWLLALAPSAYSLVLGYADAALMLCAVVTFLAARSGRWWWAAAAGLLAGLVRPVGVLLVVPVLIEVWRGRRGRSSLGGWLPAVAAVVAPVAGTGAYLGWVGAQFGDPWLPLRVQQQNGHRGAITVPLTAMWHSLDSVVHGHHLGSALHIPWVVLSVALLVVAFRRLPALLCRLCHRRGGRVGHQLQPRLVRALRARCLPPRHRRVDPDRPAGRGAGRPGRGRRRAGRLRLAGLPRGGGALTGAPADRFPPFGPGDQLTCDCPLNQRGAPVGWARRSGPVGGGSANMTLRVRGSPDRRVSDGSVRGYAAETSAGTAEPRPEREPPPTAAESRGPRRSADTRYTRTAFHERLRPSGRGRRSLPGPRRGAGHHTGRPRHGHRRGTGRAHRRPQAGRGR